MLFIKKLTGLIGVGLIAVGMCMLLGTTDGDQGS